MYFVLRPEHLVHKHLAAHQQWCYNNGLNCQTRVQKLVGYILSAYIMLVQLIRTMLVRLLSVLPTTGWSRVPAVGFSLKVTGYRKVGVVSNKNFCLFLLPMRRTYLQLLKLLFSKGYIGC